MATFPESRTEELRVEKALLLKAECDIEEGWKRLRNQQELLQELQAAGHDTAQAERLIQLLQSTLVEWERHRALIEQRVVYLEREIRP
ncbi:MAG TPA: hypothetical protein VMU69_07895 [Bradyrhizobium sp.]|nr:hypothetical protein [Bradyrhizobium sp.]